MRNRPSKPPSRPQSEFEAQVRRVATTVVGVTGSGTAGNLPKWTASTVLGDSGVSAAAVTTGSGVADQLAYWSSTSGLTGSTKLTFDSTTGNLTSAGTVIAKKLQVTDATNPNIYDATGNARYNLNADGRNAFTGYRNGGSHYFDVPSGTITSNAVMFLVNYGGAFRFTVTRDGDGQFVGALGAQTLTINGASTLTGKVSQGFTDSSGAPGAATINKPSGKSAIAASATSVVITNSVVATGSEIIITPLSIDAPAKWKAVPAAGSFTVTVDAAPAAAWAFSWWVLN